MKKNLSLSATFLLFFMLGASVSYQYKTTHLLADIPPVIIINPPLKSPGVQSGIASRQPGAVFIIPGRTQT